jgi:hypothetical protein
MVEVGPVERRLGTVKRDGSGLSGGMSFYRLCAGDFVETRTLSIVRSVAIIAETKRRPGIHWYEYYEG